MAKGGARGRLERLVSLERSRGGQIDENSVEKGLADKSRRRAAEDGGQGASSVIVTCKRMQNCRGRDWGPVAGGGSPSEFSTNWSNATSLPGLHAGHRRQVESRSCTEFNGFKRDPHKSGLAAGPCDGHNNSTTEIREAKGLHIKTCFRIQRNFQNRTYRR